MRTISDISFIVVLKACFSLSPKIMYNIDFSFSSTTNSNTDNMAASASGSNCAADFVLVRAVVVFSKSVFFLIPKKRKEKTSSCQYINKTYKLYFQIPNAYRVSTSRSYLFILFMQYIYTLSGKHLPYIRFPFFF